MVKKWRFIEKGFFTGPLSVFLLDADSGMLLLQKRNQENTIRAASGAIRAALTSIRERLFSRR